MKNYLKFIIAVFGITVALFGSIDINAKQKDKDLGGCSGATGECGKTDDGRVIVGVYNT